MKKIIYFLSVILMAFVLVSCGNRNNSAYNNIGTSSGNVVTIENFQFSPQELIIKKGDTVKWKNNDSAEHTIDFTYKGEKIVSNKLKNGEDFNFTFKDSGTIDYICSIHPSMKGKIKVE